MAAFTLDRAGKSGAIFDEEKLKWLNGLYIRQTDLHRLTERLLPFIRAAGYDVDRLDFSWLQRVVDAVRDDLATEAAPTISRHAPGVSPTSGERTHYGDSDAGVDQDDSDLTAGDGIPDTSYGDTSLRAGSFRGSGEAEETSVAGDRTGATHTNLLSVVALVLSVLGVTAPIGVYLAYTSLRTIRRTGELGAPFAEAAKWLGWLWIGFFVLGAIAYFWIGSQGS